MIKSQDDLNQPEAHSTDVLLEVISKLETTTKELERTKKQLEIAIKALESLRTKKTVIDKVTGDVYYIWDYALEKIKEIK